MTMKSEYSPTDAASRWPILFLLISGAVWLVVAGVFGLIASIQLHTPSFMAVCPIFTYGRTAAIAETAFVYGWLANAGLALALWVLQRLSGEPLRAQNWALGGTAFWNLSILGAAIGLALGDLRTGQSLEEAYLAITGAREEPATDDTAASAGRRRRSRGRTPGRSR